MKELSIFVDESGDFGEYSSHSPYYIISMIFHNQKYDISDALSKLEFELSELGYPNHCLHVGPLIRKEEDYSFASVEERRRLLNKMVSFFRQVDISYKVFFIEKKHIADSVDASGKLSKLISNFIRQHYDFFLSFDDVKIYYDNGQVEVTKILSSVFNVMLENVTFRKVFPSEFRLFQLADLLCSLTLISIKLENNVLSKSEKRFFGNPRDFKKNYFRHLKSKELK